MNIRLAKRSEKQTVIEMVNDVYYTSERKFWSEGYYRIDENDFERYIANDWLFVCVDADDSLVGCVLFKQESEDTTSFSMLVCHPDHRKKGIGRKLVDFVTSKAMEEGNQFMQLEILSPKDWVHEEKKFLKEWYGKLGYQLVREVNFKDYYPDHSVYMKCELIFSLYRKSLLGR